MVYAPAEDRTHAGGVHEAITTPVPMDMSFKRTVPVGVAVPEVLVTNPVNATLAPMVEDEGPASVRLVPIGLGVAAAHFASRLVTFTVPSPVAKSYPATALKAGVEPPGVAVVVKMPY